MSFVDIFPPELVEKVLFHLSVQDLLNVSQVSVSWHEASNSSKIWKVAIQRSTARDCNSALCDLDKFNGVASNFDEYHCFKSILSSSRLSEINPWKLSVLKNNFVRRNWRGLHTMGASHQISLNDCHEEILKMEVVFPSKSPQDCRYFPIVGISKFKNKNFYLIQLDGIPRVVKKLFTTLCQVPIACIDRHCLVWVQGAKVKSLALVDNISSSQIKDVGNLFSDLEHRNSYYYRSGEEWKFTLSMDADNIAAGFKTHSVNIWCKKTFQLKFIYRTPHLVLSPLNCINYSRFHNGRFYFSVWQDGQRESNVRIHDIQEDRTISNFTVDSKVYKIVCNDKYYVIVSSKTFKSITRISVYDMETNKIHFHRDEALRYSARRVWIVDMNILYLVRDALMIMSLIDGEITCQMLLRFDDHIYKIRREFNPILFPSSPGPATSPHRKFDIWDSFLLVKEYNKVEIYDWKLGLKLQELPLDIDDPERSFRVINDETRLVAISKEVVKILGFW